MSELAQVQKAIETAQTRMTELFDAQKKEIEATGAVSKQLQTDLTTVQEELKTAGARLFDIESKLAGGNLDNPENKKSFAAQAAEDLKKGWNGSSTGQVDVKSFSKALGSGSASAGALVQPQQLPGILMPGLRRLTIRDLLA
ncbi:phage major capsid protein, partial [Pseudomonas mosselii]